MKNDNLIAVRSNCDFSLDYTSGKLTPQTEIILITTAPKYISNKKKDSITKEFDVSEYRFKSDLDGVNKLIGELQLVVKNMIQFEQLSGSFNAIIESTKTDKSK